MEVHMDQTISQQDIEHMDAGFEVSKVLAQAGFQMDVPAFTITWGGIAEEIAHTLADHGYTLDQLSEDLLVDLAKGVQEVFQNDDILFWRDAVRAFVLSQPIFSGNANPSDEADDEGPLTEQFENATRLGDDEAYWVDGGQSADLFEGI
jgi:hypothetical protein